MDEYNRLATLNATVRGWAEYYRYTSFVQDIEDITSFAWFPLPLLVAEEAQGQSHGTARPKQIQKAPWQNPAGMLRCAKAVTRWKRTNGSPPDQELDRQRYRQKGKAGFPHPYLSGHATAASDHPQGATGPDERIYTATIGASSFNRGEPLEIVERKLRAKVRDGMQCQQCGTRTSLDVHHTRGMKSHALNHLITLCRTCHIATHRSSQLQTV